MTYAGIYYLWPYKKTEFVAGAQATYVEEMKR